MRFGLIAGIPRSDTTLAAALIDQSPDAVCVSEPQDHVSLSDQALTRRISYRCSLKLY